MEYYIFWLGQNSGHEYKNLTDFKINATLLTSFSLPVTNLPVGRQAGQTYYKETDDPAYANASDGQVMEINYDFESWY